MKFYKIIYNFVYEKCIKKTLKLKNLRKLKLLNNPFN